MHEKKHEKENKDYVVLDGIIERVKVSANHNDQQPQQRNAPQTPESGVRRYTRISRATEQYFPSLYYVMLTDSGEMESHEESMQIEKRKKWENPWKKRWNP